MEEQKLFVVVTGGFTLPSSTELFSVQGEIVPRFMAVSNCREWAVYPEPRD